MAFSKLILHSHSVPNQAVYFFSQDSPLIPLPTPQCTSLLGMTHLSYPPMSFQTTEFDSMLNITSKEKLLVKRLLKRYEKQGKEGRPVVNTSDPVKVYFSLSLIQILDVDIKDQVLKTNIWYHYVSL